MLSLRSSRLKGLHNPKNPRIKQITDWLQRPEEMLSFALLGNTLINVAASSLSAMLGFRLYGEVGVWIASMLISILLLIFGEVLPKTIAAFYPEKSALFTMYFLPSLFAVCRPLVWTMNHIIHFFMKLLGLQQTTDFLPTPILHENELHDILCHPSCPLPHHLQECILSILALEKIHAGEIMVGLESIPRIDVERPKELLRLQNHSTGYLVYKHRQILGRLSATSLASQPAEKRTVTWIQTQLDRLGHCSTSTSTHALVLDNTGTPKGILSMNTIDQIFSKGNLRSS